MNEVRHNGARRWFTWCTWLFIMISAALLVVGDVWLRQGSTRAVLPALVLFVTLNRLSRFSAPADAHRRFLLEGWIVFVVLMLCAQLTSWSQLTVLAALDALFLGVYVYRERVLRSDVRAAFTNVARWVAGLRVQEHLSRRSFACWLGLIFVAGVLLRLYGMAGTGLYDDEFQHLRAARDLLDGVRWADIYQRSLWIVTVPVAVSTKVFGFALWAARLPGALLNALAIFPIAAMMSRISRRTALLAALLFATSPWMIVIARSVREYAYYPFWFAVIGWGIIRTWELWDTRHTRPRHITRLAVQGGGLLLALVYVLFVDAQSTAKIIVVAYLAIPATLLWMWVQRGAQRAQPGVNSFSTVTRGVLLVAGVLIVSVWFDHTARLWLNLFLNDGAQHWFMGRGALVLLAGIMLTLFVAHRLRHRILVYLAAVFIGYLAFYVLVFDRYFKIRYMSFMEPWYVMLLAVGVMILAALLVRLTRSTVLTAVLLLACFINGGHLLRTTAPVVSAWSDVSGEYYNDLESAIAYVHPKLLPDDAIVGTFTAHMLFYLYGYEPASNSWYDYLDPERIATAEAAIQRSPHGWVLIDYLRNGYIESPGFPQQDFTVGTTQVIYDGLFGDIYVYHWGRELADR